MRIILNLICLSVANQCTLCRICDVRAMRLLELWYVLFLWIFERRELKLSRRDVTKACERVMVDCLSRFLWIWPMLLAAAIANWHVLLTCIKLHGHVCVKYGTEVPDFQWRGYSRLSNCDFTNLETKWSTSVFESLSGSLLLLDQGQMSLTQAFFFEMAASWSQG